MDQIRKFFDSLSLSRRLTILGVAVLVVTGVVFFFRWSGQRNFKALYTNLSAEDSGAVLAKVKESGTAYRLRESDSAILVPSEKIPELRLQMATAGIPKSGRIGYELFDKTNLGTTDFAEQVNYHRAVEGELERSVMAMAEVDQARVHITFPKESVFTENRQPAKASVMVKLKTGAALSESHAAAIAQLVASAVDGLAPEAISVMDMKGNLLVRPKKPGDGSEPSDELLKYKGTLEHDTLAKITSVLDPLLGSEKYRASVDIDCDLTSGEQSEETFDPNHSVITSSQRTEEGSIGHEASGLPGTASNLPRPIPRPQPQNGGIARRTENTSYETSRTVRRLRLPQGIVRRMSVSVLVDQNVRWETIGTGSAAHLRRIIEAPAPERMKTIQAVIASAAGFNATRGDQLTVETLPFEATLTAEPPASLLPAPVTRPQPSPKFLPMLINIGAGVLLLAILGFAIYRSRRKAAARLADMEAQLSAANTGELAALAGEDMIAEQTNANSETKAISVPDGAANFELSPMLTTRTEVLTKHVAEQARKDPAALAQIIRTWLNDSERG
jgi:flagellar M-ring protein FliF